MNKTLLLMLVALVAVGLFSPSVLVAQQKNVTFIINTATVPDSINATSSLSITGAAAHDTNDSKALTNWNTAPVLSLTAMTFLASKSFIKKIIVKFKMFHRLLIKKLARGIPGPVECNKMVIRYSAQSGHKYCRGDGRAH